MASVENALHPVPKLDRDQRLVLTLVELAVPFEPARVEAVSKDGMHSADRHRIAALGVEETGRPRLPGGFLQGILSGRIPLE